MSLNLDCVVKINHGIHFLIWAFYAMCIDEISVFLQAVGANIQSFVLSFTVPEEVALSYIFHPRDIKRKDLNIYVLQIYSVKIMKGNMWCHPLFLFSPMLSMSHFHYPFSFLTPIRLTYFLRFDKSLQTGLYI